MLLRDLALDKAQALPKPGDATPLTTMVPAAVIQRRTRFLSAEGQIATPLEQEAQIGKNDLLDVNFVERCRLAQTCVGTHTGHISRSKRLGHGLSDRPWAAVDQPSRVHRP